MFELKSQKAKLLSFNPRTEKHGNENVAAADLSFSINVGGEALHMFDPALRALLYQKIGARADMVDEISEFPDLRFPLLAPLHWDYEMVGAALSLDFGLSGFLVDDTCKINKFTFAPQQGGTCVIGFRAQCQPDEAACAKLCFLIGHSVTIHVTPPAAEPELERAAA